VFEEILKSIILKVGRMVGRWGGGGVGGGGVGGWGWGEWGGGGAPGESNHRIPTWLLLIPFIPISHQLAVLGAQGARCKD
jgi:hypothetical protein